MPALSIRDLQVHAGQRLLLDIPHLDLPAGGLMGVSGASGAGKTTFLNAIAGLIGARGSVRWGDQEVLHMTQGARTHFRRQNMGMIFQDFLLFEELSAIENATIAACFAPRRDRPALRRRAMALMDRLGIAALAHCRADHLSGGERQRVATARALAAGPRILLADEPTAALDRGTADALIDDLVALVRDQGRTVIAVSHDPRVLARMDRVLCLQDGRQADAG